MYIFFVSESVKAHLGKANSSFLNKNSKPFINYLSASGGVFPYFVASGKSSPGTNAPLLITGLTEPSARGRYPDFPRINRVGIIATIAFQGTNILTRDYIKNNKPSYVGIIVSDFPGQSLINSVIWLNPRTNMQFMLRR